MFPKCFLDARNISTLSEHSADIPEILRAGWVVWLQGRKCISDKSILG